MNISRYSASSPGTNDKLTTLFQVNVRSVVPYYKRGKDVNYRKCFNTGATQACLLQLRNVSWKEVAGCILGRK